MSDTYFNADAFEYLQDLVCGLSEGLCELSPEEFSYFLAHGSLDQDVELN